METLRAIRAAAVSSCQLTPRCARDADGVKDLILCAGLLTEGRCQGRWRQQAFGSRSLRYLWGAVCGGPSRHDRLSVALKGTGIARRESRCCRAQSPCGSAANRGGAMPVVLSGKGNAAARWPELTDREVLQDPVRGFVLTLGLGGIQTG
jgi:hypothetical protein